MILGLLFGAIGFHNFYAGRYAIGLVRVFLACIALAMDTLTGYHTGFFFVVMAISGVASLIEIIVVKRDSMGVAMS